MSRAILLYFWLVSGVVFAGLMPACALALSDQEYEAFKEEIDFRVAESMLERAWQKALSLSDASQRAILERSQNDWLESDRDKQAKTVSENYKGIEPQLAYAIVTVARARFLDSVSDYLRKAGDKHLEQFLAMQRPERLIDRLAVELLELSYEGADLLEAKKGKKN